jgi:hypothetical protein
MPVHQNSKKSNHTYLRSSGTVMDLVKNVVKTKKNTNVEYARILRNRDPQESVSELPRNSKQIYNQRYYEKKKQLEIEGIVKSKDQFMDAIINLR